jgi:hypothetical protein
MGNGCSGPALGAQGGSLTSRQPFREPRPTMPSFSATFVVHGVGGTVNYEFLTFENP